LSELTADARASSSPTEAVLHASLQASTRERHSGFELAASGRSAGSRAVL